MNKLTEGTMYEIQFKTVAGEWVLWGERAKLSEAQRLAHNVRIQEKKELRVVDCNGEICEGK